MLEYLFNLLQTGGLLILFLLIFIEGNPIFGFFIPGSIIVVFYGFFVSTQPNQYLLFTLFVIMLASVLGDLVGFYLGRKLGIKGLKRFGVDKNSILFKTSSKFFNNYGLLSIVLGRQINFTRAFIPFFAGLSTMRASVFTVVAIVSGILWTLVTFMLGYYFGFVVVKKFEFVFGFLIFLLVYSLIIHFIYRFVKKIYSQNVVKIRRYAFLNISSILFLSLLSLTLLALKSTSLPSAINSSLEFLIFSVGPLVFITSKIFILLFFSILFFTPLYLKKFKLFIIFIWSSFLFIQFTFLSLFFVNLFFKVKLSFSIFMMTYGVFLLLLLIYEIKELKYHVKQYLIFFIMFILMLFTLVYSIKHGGDFYKILISFIVATIGCEVLYVLSHYKIVDNHICDSIKKG
jgi:membrane-associated protein